MVDKYTEDMAVDSSMIRSELGFMPEYDLSRGWVARPSILCVEQENSSVKRIYRIFNICNTCHHSELAHD
jgi:hypothetical protein